MSVYSEDTISAAIQQATRKLSYSKFTVQQQQTVTKFTEGKDVFVCLTTGSGKSLCYSMLPAAFDHLLSREL